MSLLERESMSLANGNANANKDTLRGGTATDLREELRALVAEIAEKDEIPDGASFKELGIDSMMGVEIVAAIERQYHIKIDDDEILGFTDLDAACGLVVKKLEAKAGTAAAE
jgi:acyl carrier protein